jgi:hypothetical protein
MSTDIFGLTYNSKTGEPELIIQVNYPNCLSKTVGDISVPLNSNEVVMFFSPWDTRNVSQMKQLFALSQIRRNWHFIFVMCDDVKQIRKFTVVPEYLAPNCRQLPIFRMRLPFSNSDEIFENYMDLEARMPPLTPLG